MPSSAAGSISSTLGPEQAPSLTSRGTAGAGPAQAVSSSSVSGVLGPEQASSSTSSGVSGTLGSGPVQASLVVESVAAALLANETFDPVETSVPKRAGRKPSKQPVVSSANIAERAAPAVDCVSNDAVEPSSTSCLAAAGTSSSSMTGPSGQAAAAQGSFASVGIQNPWNLFQHRLRNRGLTVQQMAKLYKDEKAKKMP